MNSTYVLARTAVLLAALSAAAPALSHHSFAMFDTKSSVTINGTVTKFEWTNPHSWLWVEVRDEQGGSKVWGIETGSPSMLERRGLKRTTFKAGDQLVIELHPMRDGSPGGNFMKATFPDGRSYAIVVGKEEQ